MSANFLDLIYAVNTSNPIVVTFNYGKEYVDSIKYMYKGLIETMGNRIKIKDNKLIFSNSKAMREFFAATPPEVDYVIMELSVNSGELNFLLE